MNDEKAKCIFCMILIVLSAMNVSALAVEHNKQIIDLGDGYYMVEAITQYTMPRAGDTASGSKAGNVYFGSTWIGVATLTASFDISGSSAKATNAYITGSGKNGGSYSRGTTRLSGNTVYGTAYFTYNGTQKSVSISISCSSDGTLS